MKGLCPSVVCVFLMLLGASSYADPSAEEMLKAIVKIKATVPKEAFTASTLGTEREGHGVLIDTEGHILTIGYLITEAETIEVTGPEGKAVGATFVGYDQKTGFGLLRIAMSLGVAPMKLGESSRVKEGDPLLVAGYGGADSVIAARVVSRKEFAGYWEYLLEDPIITAPAYLSFGGAALIDPKGELVGIGSLFTQLAIPGLGAIRVGFYCTPPTLRVLSRWGFQAKSPWTLVTTGLRSRGRRGFSHHTNPANPGNGRIREPQHQSTQLNH